MVMFKLSIAYWESSLLNVLFANIKLFFTYFLYYMFFFTYFLNTVIFALCFNLKINL